MIRTQIQLTEEQAVGLRQLSAATGRSMADLVREAVDGLALGAPPGDRHQRALRAVGAHAGDGTRVAADHDSYLDAAFAD